jgi:ATP-dependent DNA helicase HFM1/MER3
MRFRVGEKTAYKDLNKSPSIKFPIPVNLDLPAHKVSLIVQSVLGDVELPIETSGSPVFHQYRVEQGLVFNQLKRLIRCIIDFELQKEDSNSLRNSLMIFRSVSSRCWDDSPLQMKQIDQIGPVTVRKLVNAGINTLDVLEATEPHRIEAVLGRAPPFGRKVLDSMRSFPKLRVSLQIVGQVVSSPSLSRTHC